MVLRMASEGLTITALSRDHTCERSSEKQEIKAAWSVLQKTKQPGEMKEAQSRQRGQEDTCTEVERNKQGPGAAHDSGPRGQGLSSCQQF